MSVSQVLNPIQSTRPYKLPPLQAKAAYSLAQQIIKGKISISQAQEALPEQVFEYVQLFIDILNSNDPLLTAANKNLDVLKCIFIFDKTLVQNHLKIVESTLKEIDGPLHKALNRRNVLGTLIIGGDHTKITLFLEADKLSREMIANREKYLSDNNQLLLQKLKELILIDADGHLEVQKTGLSKFKRIATYALPIIIGIGAITAYMTYKSCFLL